MRQRGFTLVEMLFVVAIMGILMSFAGLKYNAMQTKSLIEQEAATIYGTLLELRLQALYRKTGRAATLVGKQFSTYSSQVTTVSPISTIVLTYPVKMGPTTSNRVVFDASGMMMSEERAICVDPSGTLADNLGFKDSVNVSITKIHIGKRRSGSACEPDFIDQK